MSTPTSIQLIAGLGNPGAEYAATRHNAGFWFVERLAEQAGAAFRSEAKFHGDVCKVRWADQDLWLLKPQTFMNESGRAVQAMASFYKIPPTEILVVHDEVDLPVGVARLKSGGGHGGNNGLRSICAHIGNDFLRLRIGVDRPPSKAAMTNHVLNRPTMDQSIAIERASDDAEAALRVLLKDGLEKAMHQLHSAARDEGRKKKAKAPVRKEPKNAAPATPVDDSGSGAASRTTQHRTPAAKRRADSDDQPAATTSLREQLLNLLRKK